MRADHILPPYLPVLPAFDWKRYSSYEIKLANRRTGEHGEIFINLRLRTIILRNQSKNEGKRQYLRQKSSFTEKKYNKMALFLLPQ